MEKAVACFKLLFCLWPLGMGPPLKRRSQLMAPWCVTMRMRAECATTVSRPYAGRSVRRFGKGLRTVSMEEGCALFPLQRQNDTK
jgi:hypothetical protein